MRNSPSNEPLEARLLKLPLLKVIEALEAIDALDQYLLEAYEKSGDQAKLHAWRDKIKVRRWKRDQFLEFRLSMESAWLN